MPCLMNQTKNVVSDHNTLSLTNMYLYGQTAYPVTPSYARGCELNRTTLWDNIQKEGLLVYHDNKITDVHNKQIGDCLCG